MRVREIGVRWNFKKVDLIRSNFPGPGMPMLWTLHKETRAMSFTEARRAVISLATFGGTHGTARVSNTYLPPDESPRLGCFLLVLRRCRRDETRRDEGGGHRSKRVQDGRRMETIEEERASSVPCGETLVERKHSHPHVKEVGIQNRQYRSISIARYIRRRSINPPLVLYIQALLT